MPSRTEHKAWDLSSPVADLLRVLSSPTPPKYEAPPHVAEQAPAAPETQQDQGLGSLGDFSKIFQFLESSSGAPSESSMLLPSEFLKENTDRVASTAKGDVQQRVPLPVEEKKDYTSDGAVYRPPVSKGVRFLAWSPDEESDDLHRTKSQDSGEDTTSTAPDSFSDAAKAAHKAARNREKKARQKANRRARAAATGLESQPADKAVSDVEGANRGVHTPARKASVHTTLLEPITPTPTVESKAKSKKSKNKGEGLQSKGSTAQQDIALAGASVGLPPPTPKSVLSSSPTKKPAILSRNALLATPERPIIRKPPASERPGQQPLFQPVVQSAGFAPIAALFSNQNALTGSTLAPYVVNPEFYGSSPPRRGGSQGRRLSVYKQPSVSAKPFTIRHGTDRHEYFFLELLRQFPQDKKWLLSPAVLSNHSTNPEGIHVFVDASNIFVGFFEHLKKLFGLKQGRIEGLQISFDALVLLLERRRPVAKRVVVGSDARLPAFQMAKAIGYETSILEQVYKDQDMTKRQKRHYYQLSGSAQNSGGGNGVGGSSSNAVHTGGYGNASHVPETAPDASAGFSSHGYQHHHPHQRPPSPTRPGDPQKWVEQGVDELIHLKMLESIVDAERPATMVLATGDAAVAEYSQGFLKMVERALSKGWSVEVVAWSDGISKAYKDKRFREKWGDRFRIVELDDFVEGLVDT